MTRPQESQRGLFVRFPLVLALSVLGVAFGVSAVVDMFGGGEVASSFGAAAIVCAAAARVVGQTDQDGFPEVPAGASVPAVMTMAALCWVVVALGGGVAHLISDSTRNVNTAVFEGMAAITTTSMTALDPDALPTGLHMFRALMQWFGGLGGIALTLVAVPILFGGRELAGRLQSSGENAALITGRTRGFGNLLALYGGFTMLVVLGFRAAGMGNFDSVAHGLATVSTGGLSTQAGSLAAFDSAAVEWVAVAAMSLAGLSLGVAWWILNKNWRALRDNTELRLFATILLASTALLALWSTSNDSGLASVRAAALAVSSAMSTTGFTSGSWSSFPSASATLLVVLMSVGAMGGSGGGGVGYLRLIEAAGYAQRELRLQLHPAAVGVVRVNGQAVQERTLQRLVGYLVAYFLVAAAGAMLVAMGDSQIGPIGAVTLAVSALSTTGAQTVDALPLSEVGGVSKWSLAGLMLLGRISIYSGIVAVVTVAAKLREIAR